MVVIVVKRYAVREAEKWRYAVRKGGGGCHPLCMNAAGLVKVGGG